MDKKMMAYCGTYCASCEWKDKTNCKGCISNKGDLFWGKCDAALCCIEKKLNHCGECSQVPCDKLSALYSDPEHGDNGERLANLKSWAENK